MQTDVNLKNENMMEEVLLKQKGIHLHLLPFIWVLDGKKLMEKEKFLK